MWRRERFIDAGLCRESFDVFIPLASKDLPILDVCVRSVRRHVEPPPNRIVVVGEAGLEPRLREVSERQIEFFSAGKLRNVTPLEGMPVITVDGIPRTGWYYQQFIKWALRQVSYTDDYLVVDADTAFVRPIRFEIGGKYIFYRYHKHHAPYFTTFERLLGYKPEPSLSFIAGFMIFSKPLLEELVTKIETTSGNKWYEAILSAIDRNELSSFSEFETYGNFLAYEHPDSFKSIQTKCFVSSRGVHPGLFLPRKYLPAHRVVSWGARLSGYTTIQYHHYHPMNHPLLHWQKATRLT